MVSFGKAFISTILFVGGSFFIPGLAGAGDTSVQAPFNVGEVIERVSHHPRMEVNRVVIRDKTREVGFEERTPASSGEILLDTTVVYVPAEGRQWFPAVAFDGVNYLVVWEDGRNGWNGLDIYGTRVSRDGRILDEAGIVISASLGNQQTPSVAFDGTNFLVVWMDLRTLREIYAARVSPDGAVLDPDGIVISSTSCELWQPSVTFGGTNYLVVWSSNMSCIYGSRVSPDGAVLDPNGITIAPGANDPSVSFDGTNYFVVWSDYRGGTFPDIYGSRVSQGGVVLDTTGIAISTRVNRVEEETSVAFDGTNYLVTWKDGRNSTYDIYAARISRGGVVLDSNGIAVSTAAYDQFEPSIAFDGNNYFLAWEDHRSGPNRDIYGSRVTPGGAVLDTSGIPISTAANHQWNPALVFDGANYMVVWWDNRSGTDVYGADLTP